MNKTKDPKKVAAGKKGAAKRQPTAKQEAFAFEYIMNGRNASDAYRKVYDVSKDIKPETVWRDAHTILHTPKVLARIGVLQKEQYHGDIMTIEERKLMLTALARTGDIKSVDLLNKMESVYVEKQEITVTELKPLEDFYK